MDSQSEPNPERETVVRSVEDRRNDAIWAAICLCVAALLTYLALTGDVAKPIRVALVICGSAVVGGYLAFRATRKTTQALTAHGEQLREQRINELKEQWWIRYPAGVAILWGIWWLLSDDQFSNENGSWLLWISAAAAAIYALWLTREVSKYLIGLVALMIAWQWLAGVADSIDRIPPGRAIIVGAIIVAVAIYASRSKE